MQKRSSDGRLPMFPAVACSCAGVHINRHSFAIAEVIGCRGDRRMRPCRGFGGPREVQTHSRQSLVRSLVAAPRLRPTGERTECRFRTDRRPGNHRRLEGRIDHPARSARDPLRRTQDAHRWRRERRGLLLLRRRQAHLPVDPRALRLRSDLHHESRRLRPAAGLHRHRADHLRLLLPRGRLDRLRLDPRGRRRLSADSRSQPRLCLAHLSATTISISHGRTGARSRSSPTTPATTPRRRSPPPAIGSSSPPCATATSRSTP